MQERLQKIIARAGISSRRTAETLIRDGKVSVNDVVVKTLGSKADPDRDDIRVNGRLISTEVSPVYLMLNKPPGYMTTLKDPEGRPVVTELIVGVAERVFPVGRLDYDSAGLLILTNDGEFAQKLQHPRYRIPKTYLIKIKGQLSRRQWNDMAAGVELEDGFFVPKKVGLEKINPKSTWVRMTILEGRNRVIRRFFDVLGHPVARLIRTAIGEVEIGDLREGEFRPLRRKEVEQLLSLSRRRDDRHVT